MTLTVEHTPPTSCNWEGVRADLVGLSTYEQHYGSCQRGWRGGHTPGCIGVAGAPAYAGVRPPAAADPWFSRLKSLRLTVTVLYCACRAPQKL